MSKIITLAAVALSLAIGGAAQARDLRKEFRTGFNPEGTVKSDSFRTGVDLGSQAKPDSFRTGVDLGGI